MDPFADPAEHAAQAAVEKESVEDVVSSETGKFTAYTIERMNHEGTFRHMVEECTDKILRQGTKLAGAVRINTYWALILFYAWLQHFEALSPAWRSGSGTDGTTDGQSIMNAGLQKTSSFASNHTIKVFSRY